MKKTLAIIFTCLCIINIASAQFISGVVKDAKTNQPLPFVNVGIVGKSVGTVTDAAGAFKLNVGNNTTDILKVSMIGYQGQAFAVADLLKNETDYVMSLEPEITALNEVKIQDRKWSTKQLGNFTRSDKVIFNFGGNQLGNEVGTIINIKKSPSRLKRFTAHLLENHLTDSVKVRLNVYTIKNGPPLNNIAPKNIYTTVHRSDKEINIDLEPYGILVSEDFFVSLEWLQSTPGRSIMFSASLFDFKSNNNIILREASQGQWQKVALSGIGFNMLVEQ